jgi:outer membrane protein assembly factor BamB
VAQSPRPESVLKLRGMSAWMRWRLATRLLSCIALMLSACRGPSEPRDGLVEVWFQSQPAPPFTYSRPEVVDDVVLMGAPSGHLFWRQVQNGNITRSAAVCGPGGPQGRRLATTATVVAVFCHDRVVGLSLSTGTTLWTYTPPNDTTYDGRPGYVGGTYPASDGSMIYVPAWGPSVTALSAATGVPAWTWRAGRFASDTAANVFRSGAAGVAISGDTVFVTLWHFTNRLGGTIEALLLALDRDTGAELWHLVMPVTGGGGNIDAPPAIAGDLAIVSTVNGWIFGVRRATAQVAWQFRSTAYTWSTIGAPALADGMLYADAGDDRLTALHAATGAVAWSVPSTGATKDITAAGNRVYVPRYGELAIHDRGSGALLATGRVKESGQTFTTAAVARGGQVFITSSEGAWSFLVPE